MAVTVAEYFGQRTDVNTSNITPITPNPGSIPPCPFTGVPCSKMSNSNRYPPVCVVRYGGRPWIVCSHRLIPAKAQTWTPRHVAALRQVTDALFPNVPPSDVGYRRQITVRSGTKHMVLDYVLNLRSSHLVGPSKVIMEVQGGGETSNTGYITRHVADWASQPFATNSYLSQPVSQASIIPNNAWKRQLEQILRKATLAKRNDGAFALVMGEVLYDYARGLVPSGIGYRQDWEVALVGIGEGNTTQAGSEIPFDRLLGPHFMTFADFIAAISNFPITTRTINPFEGSFDTLTGSSFTTP